MEPWANCTKLTRNGSACYEVFENGVCNEECDTELCLLDGFDCKDQREPEPHCWYSKLSLAYFARFVCHVIWLCLVSNGR